MNSVVTNVWLWILEPIHYGLTLYVLGIASGFILGRKYQLSEDFRRTTKTTASGYTITFTSCSGVGKDGGR